MDIVRNHPLRTSVFDLVLSAGRDLSFLAFFVVIGYGTAVGGDDGVRTHDPLLAGQVLSQLSYTPD